MDAVGSISGTIDVDPDSGTLTMTSKNVMSAVVEKLSPSGGLMWAKQLAAGGNSRVEGYDVALDGSGNVFVGGNYEGKGTSTPEAAPQRSPAWAATTCSWSK